MAPVNRPALWLHGIGAVVITVALGLLVLGTVRVGCGGSLDFYAGASPETNAMQWFAIVGWALVGSWPFWVGWRLLRRAADRERPRIWARTVRSWLYGVGYLGVTAIVPGVLLALIPGSDGVPVEPCYPGGLGLVLGIGLAGLIAGAIMHITIRGTEPSISAD